MSIVTIFLASASLSLAAMGPDGCPLCDTKDKGADAKAVALPEINAELYAKAEWPAFNPERNLYSKNLQGKAMPAKFGKETVLSERTLEDTKGKVLIVDFWATWCGPCLAAVPKLAALQEKYDDDLQVVGVSGLNEDQETVASYLEKKEEPFVQLYDSKQTVLSHFQTRGIPLVLVVSTDGVIRWMGNPHQPDFKTAVEQVLAVDPLIKAKAKIKAKANDEG